MPKHRGSPDVARGIQCLNIIPRSLAGRKFGRIAGALGQKRRTCPLVVSRAKEPVGSDDMLDLLDYFESGNARDIGERQQESKCNHVFSRNSCSDVRRVMI
jgi:hypothetical protein